MLRSFAVALVVLASVSGEAAAQVEFDQDFGGHRIRIGDSVYGYRDNGFSYDYHRFGDIQLYNDSAGTSGTRIYMNGGRYDSYSNPSRGMSSSGYYPYSSSYSYPSTTNRSSLYPSLLYPSLPYPSSSNPSSSFGSNDKPSYAPKNAPKPAGWKELTPEERFRVHKNRDNMAKREAVMKERQSAVTRNARVRDTARQIRMRGP